MHRLIALVRPLAAAFLALIITAAPASAQTNWTNTAGDSWNNALNWSAGIPDLTTVATFGPNPAGAATVNLDGAASALGIQIVNPGGLLTIANGTGTNTLTLGASGIDMVNATQGL